VVPGKASDGGVTAADNRRFLEAVLRIARAGPPWRNLPAEFGNWHSTYTRFSRWCKAWFVDATDGHTEARPQLGGALLQPHQAIQTCGDALRERYEKLAQNFFAMISLA